MVEARGGRTHRRRRCVPVVGVGQRVPAYRCRRRAAARAGWAGSAAPPSATCCPASPWRAPPRAWTASAAPTTPPPARTGPSRAACSARSVARTVRHLERIMLCSENNLGRWKSVENILSFELEVLGSNKCISTTSWGERVS